MARFDWIYGNNQNRSSWDIDLTPECEFATVPSIGGLVPNWLLIMPRQHFASISQMTSPARIRLLQHARRVMDRIGNDTQGEQVAFFEHGAAQTGSATGCGVDHAHLHAVPLPFSLSQRFLKDYDLASIADSDDPWSSHVGPEYLLCIDSNGAYVAPVVETVSQAFRRMIATAIGHRERWNYHEFPFAENITKTVRNFHVQ